MDTTLEHEVKRYAAYFRGWCQAFGEHQAPASADNAISWLLAEQQVGLILARPLTRALYRETLGQRREPPPLCIGPQQLQVGAFCYRFRAPLEQPVRETLTGLLEGPHDLHLYLTYHFMYAPGTRIMTLSRSKPLHIIYKGIGTMRIRLLPGDDRDGACGAPRPQSRSNGAG